jgi:hypothetical protein
MRTETFYNNMEIENNSPRTAHWLSTISIVSIIAILINKSTNMKIYFNNGHDIVSHLYYICFFGFLLSGLVLLYNYLLYWILFSRIEEEIKTIFIRNELASKLPIFPKFTEAVKKYLINLIIIRAFFLLLLLVLFFFIDLEFIRQWPKEIHFISRITTVSFLIIYLALILLIELPSVWCGKMYFKRIMSYNKSYSSKLIL